MRLASKFDRFPPQKKLMIVESCTDRRFHLLCWSELGKQEVRLGTKLGQIMTIKKYVETIILVGFVCSGFQSTFPQVHTTMVMYIFKVTVTLRTFE